MVLKIIQGFFDEPKTGMTALLVASNSIGKAVVEGYSDEASGKLYPTCLAFHMQKESKFWC